MNSTRKNSIFFTLCTSCVGLALLSTAINTALAPMSAELGVSAATGQWLVSGHALALAVVMPTTAFLVTRFPARVLYLGALALFVVASNVGMCIPALNESLAFLFASTILRYLSIGLLQMPLMTWGNSALQRVHLAQGTALITSFRNAFGAIGVAVFVGLFDSYGVGIAYAGMAFASCLLFTLRLRSSQ